MELQLNIFMWELLFLNWKKKKKKMRQNVDSFKRSRTIVSLQGSKRQVKCVASFFFFIKIHNSVGFCFRDYFKLWARQRGVAQLSVFLSVCHSINFK